LPWYLISLSYPDNTRQWICCHIYTDLRRFYTRHLLWQCQILGSLPMGGQCPESRSKRSWRAGAGHPHCISSQCMLMLAYVTMILTIFSSQVLGFKNDSSSKLAQHRAQVYHVALEIVFSDLSLAAKHGTVFKIFRRHMHGMPIFAAVSADYEEMSVIIFTFQAHMLMNSYRVRISGIRGANSKYPCPMCLVPRTEQWDFGHTWQPRTKEVTDALLAKASLKKTDKARKESLKCQSLRFLHVSSQLDVFAVLQTELQFLRIYFL
jgi:hypothetical protein